MVSAAGSGELLFTPRVGSLYGYALLWALVVAVTLKWFVNREVGRYTVCTGRSILEGFDRLARGRRWPLLIILAPQLVVAVATIAGLAGSAATAVVVAFDGDERIWAVVATLLSTALVVWGRYGGVERAATLIALALGLGAIAAAVTVFDSPGDVAAGLAPRVPNGVEIDEVLPWLGFMLSGAAGMIWYSYWLRARGAGAAGADFDVGAASEEDRDRLVGWVGQTNLDNTVAVVGTLVVTLAFLVLGAELLRPAGLVPEEGRVAEVLGELLGGVWGRAGFWFMILAVFVGFWDTLLSDQDGFGRMFANGARLLSRRVASTSEEALRQRLVVIVLTALPLVLYLGWGEPVGLLKLAGAVEAAHIPVLAVLTLVLNHRELPREVRPSRLATVVTTLSAAFFAAFALAFVVTLL